MGTNDVIVKLYGTWASPYFWRVQWALECKGIAYDDIEEDHLCKSGDLLMGKVPMLVCNHKIVTELGEFINYIDKKWRRKPFFLPKDPEERGRSRSWADIRDQRISKAITKAFFAQREKEKAEAIEEVQEILKDLDKELEGKILFGGNYIGCIEYADLTLGWLSFWLEVFEEVAGFQAMNKTKFPSLHSWMTKFLQEPAIKMLLPPRPRTIEYFRKFRQDNLYGFRPDMLASSSSSTI